MLLFLLREGLHPLPKEPPLRCSSMAELRADARALVAAGLSLLVWCGLRLIAATREGMSVDIVLAVGSAWLGAHALLRGANALRS
jgi:hypothetical protein